jgi:hypothetical protein
MSAVLGGGGGTISRWNGTRWRVEHSAVATKLVAIATDKRTHLWAVGSAGNPTDEDDQSRPFPLIERYGC